MKLSEVTDTIEIQGIIWLDDFLKAGWIIVNTRNTKGKDYYILGRKDPKKQLIPESYTKMIDVLAKVYRKK